MLNALTIDVEEYFHAENLRAAYPRAMWPRLESRVEEPLGWLLDALARRSVKATFFVLGWLATRRAEVVKRILAGGHEVASHGYGHDLLTRLDRESFRLDVRRASDAIAAACGARPRGYRAPCFTVVKETRWALEVLAEEGYAYDSSVYPIVHDRYGDPDAPRFPHEVDLPQGRRIVEAPLTTARAFGRNWPVAGGGYLRLLPIGVVERALASLEREGRPAIVYLHPWELDPGQPRHGVSFLRRWRHGVGTRGLRWKLEALLDRFPMGRLDEVLALAGLGSRTEARA
jgi:polysaccharide deacetylase family protein (PEP-CTERM system associated)